MKKSTVWIIVASSLILIGTSLFAVAMTAYQWDFKKLSTVEYETTTHTVGDDFSSIKINVDTANVKFLMSDNGECSVVCHEPENEKHSVSVTDGVLCIDRIPPDNLINCVGINYYSTAITIYLPKTTYAELTVTGDTGNVEIPSAFSFESAEIKISTGDITYSSETIGSLNLKASTGDIKVESISVGSMNIRVSTGSVTVREVTCAQDIEIISTTGKSYLSNVSCASFKSMADTGDLNMKSVIASGKLSIERSTGDVMLEGCDANELDILTDTGDVVGTLLSEKIFIINTDTGDIDVPRATSGGLCEITTDTGDVEISIE